MNIFLIGYRATGKSTVGEKLAGRLNRPFVDADDKLAAACAMSIHACVARHGWDYFRRMEKTLLKQICRRDRQVVATGGGVVLDHENVAEMKKSGVLIWLKAEPETIKDRLLQDGKTGEFRPAFTPGGVIREVEEILRLRNPLYEAAMDFSVITDRTGYVQICDMIMNKLSNFTIS
jgi:shikimate kinase